MSWSSDIGRPVLLVTGGSRGIGAAIVTGAVSAGWSVCFSFEKDREAADRLALQLDPLGERVMAICGDVAHRDFAARFFDEAEDRLGPACALVNNAGITGHYGSFLDTPFDAAERTMQVNYFGSASLAREAVRRWIGRGTSGSLVNLSSIAAHSGAPGEYVHYAASKAAVEALTIGLAKEVAEHGIRVNAVSPGTTMTDIHAANGVPDRPSRVAKQIPMRRVAEPEEIAEVVLWLLSEKSSYVTGTVVRASGGL